MKTLSIGLGLFALLLLAIPAQGNGSLLAYTFRFSQPWVEYSGDKYVVRSGGASQQILNSLPGKRITLYRGTVPQEATFSAFIKILLATQPPNHDELLSKWNELEKQVDPGSNLGKALSKIAPNPVKIKRKAFAQNLAEAFATDLFCAK